MLASASFSHISAQGLQEMVRFGDEAFAEGDYYGAALYFQKALEEKKGDIELTYKLAESCRLFNNYREAENAYEFVVMNDAKEQYPMARFWHALMVKNNGKYTIASRNFKEYYLRNKNKQDYYTQRAYHEIESCKAAVKLLTDTVPVKIRHLDARVNSIYSESGAYQSGDTALYFSSLRPETESNYNSVIESMVVSKIFMARFLTSGISTGETAGNRLNSNSENTANIAFNASGDKVFFTRCNYEKNNKYICRIWTAKKEGGKWLTPAPLNSSINLKGYTSTQPSAGYDNGREVLYFSSDRPKGYGNMDIWYALYNGNDYDEPVNAGGTVNTPGDEITPYYDSYRRILYFSSDWHEGLGGFDIFSSKGGISGREKTLNVGFPLNSGSNDLYFSVNTNDTSGSEGYFTSNRPGSFFIKGETCCNDIFHYKKLKAPPKAPPVAVDTLKIEESVRELLPLTLYFHNDEPDAATEKTTTRKNYKSTVDDYLSMIKEYKKQYGGGLADSLREIAENEIDTFFNKYVTAGFSKLEKFTQLLLRDLQRGSDVKITIKGFTSPLNTQAYNINLAKRRISSLKNYFNEYGNGVFLPYLENHAENGGRLTLFEDPIGKALANAGVSDDPNDPRNSVYSPAAGIERRIQIILYSSGSKDTIAGNSLTEAAFNADHFTFGKIPRGEKTGYTFHVMNTGKDKLYITAAESDNPLVKTDWTRSAIHPGSAGLVNVLINEPAENGEISASITLYLNVKEGKKILTVKAEVTDPESVNIKPEGQEKNPRNKKK